MMTRGLTICMLAGCVLACSESVNAPVQDEEPPAAGLVGSGYTLSDLGTPLPCADGKASGINEAGDIIVGFACSLATMWQDNGPVTLGTLPGHTWSLADAVNDSGQIVGSSGSGSFGSGPEAFVYTPGTGMVSIHDPTLLSVSWANEINNAGVVVGTGKTDGGVFRAFSWTAADGMQLLQLTDVSATDINDMGTIAGYEVLSSSKNGVIWSGVLVSQIGTMGGDISVARGINDAGYVVGASELDDDETIHAFRYSPFAGTRKFMDLGPPSSAYSAANKISDQGRIVGSAGVVPDAIMWYNGVRSYLPDLGGVSVAYDVSRCGTIVGVAYTSNGALKRPVRWDSDVPDCRRRN